MWLWFWTLSAQRGEGPAPISYRDIEAWAVMTGTYVLPEEVAMLVAMDSAYRTEVRKELADYQERMKSKQKRR